MTIVVAGFIDLENEDNRASVLKGAKPYIEAAWQERGCVAYNWSPDPFNPNRIHVFEEWAEEQDLAEHLVGRPYIDMLGHLRGARIIRCAQTRCPRGPCCRLRSKRAWILFWS